MNIDLIKFGSTLASRQSGKEAFLAFQPNLKNIADDENIEIDFSEINTFTPAWGDEFLSPLQKKYMNKLFLIKTSNPSVKATVDILEETNKMKFIWKD